MEDEAMSGRTFGWGLLLASVLCSLGAGSATATDSVTSVNLFVEPPTLSSLGFEWRIDGDDNRNASVEVQYRKAGDSVYKTGLPVLRLQGERTLENVRFD